MNCKYDNNVKKVFKRAEREMFDLNHPYVGSEHMMLGILKSNTPESSILNNNFLTYDNFKESLIKIIGTAKRKSEIILYTPLLKKIIINAEKKCELINIRNLLLSLIEEGEGICVRILLNMGIDLKKIYAELAKDNKLLSIGKELTGKLHSSVYKRENELQIIMETLLRKNKNNPLLIGEAGTGKTAIIEELANLITKNKVPDALKNYKIISIDTCSLISGTKYRGEFEEKLKNIIEDAIAQKNIIIFIDEIHTLVNCGGAEGAIEASNILKPYLARSELKIIGATTPQEYKNSIKKDSAFDRRFQIVNITEPSLKETEYILKKIKPIYENYHNVYISNKNIKEIVNLADKYIYNKYNPDKCIDILDSVCAHVKLSYPGIKPILCELETKKEKILKPKYKDVLEKELNNVNENQSNDKIFISSKDILKIVQYKANIPVMDIFNNNLLNLPNILKNNIYGQNEQIDEVCKLLKTKYMKDNNTLLSILIKGPIGCGKSLLANEIGNNLFKDSYYLKLNMTEFTSEMSISRLLGTNAGYIGYQDECLLDKINDYPRSLILIDNIDKASENVISLFKEILKEGKITNSKGNLIHFNNCTIIFTSSENILTKIGFYKSYRKNDGILDEYVDKTIVLNSITKNSAKKYIKRETHNVKISDSQVNEIVALSNISLNGMRGVQRELNRYKSNKLLMKL